MDITPPITTSPRTATAETQAPRTTAASAYNPASSAQLTPQTPPAQEQGTTPTPLAPAPCPACATPSHWPWIIALLVGGGLGWYVGSRKKAR